MANPLLRILNRLALPSASPTEQRSEHAVKGIPHIPANLPLIGNALGFAADGFHPDKTFARWHDEYGARFIANVPVQGTMLVTSDPNDIPPSLGPMRRL